MGLARAVDTEEEILDLLSRTSNYTVKVFKECNAQSKGVGWNFILARRGSATTMYAPRQLRTTEISFTLTGWSWYLGRLLVADSLHRKTGADRIASTSFSLLFFPAATQVLLVLHYTSLSYPRSCGCNLLRYNAA